MHNSSLVFTTEFSLTYNKIHRSQVVSLMTFDSCIYLNNHHPNMVENTAIPSQSSSMPAVSAPPWVMPPTLQPLSDFHCHKLVWLLGAHLLHACAYKPPSVYYSPVDQHLGFQFLTIINETATYALLWTYVFISLE